MTTYIIGGQPYRGLYRDSQRGQKIRSKSEKQNKQDEQLKEKESKGLIEAFCSSSI